MKALSLKQPWAWALLNGKPVENRKWKTSFRGSFLIHASKGFDYEGWQWLIEHEVQLKINPPNPEDYQKGGIIGIADLVDCVTEHKSPWFFGPYGFVIKKPTPLVFMPCRGKLNFFDVEYKFKEDDMAKKDGGKAASTKLNSTAKGIDKLVVSFIMDNKDHKMHGQEVRPQTSYKDQDAVELEVTALATRYEVPEKCIVTKFANTSGSVTPRTPNVKEAEAAEDYKPRTPETELADIRKMIHEKKEVQKRIEVEKDRSSTLLKKLNTQLGDAEKKINAWEDGVQQLDLYKDQPKPE